MAEVHLVTADKRVDAAADVIFVHGLGGDKLSTWQSSKSPDSFWPAWLTEDLAHIGAYSFGYDASPSAWLGHAMPLSDRATNLLAVMEAEEFGARPIIWVCHSLGGLVVKQLLRTSATLGQESWRRFAELTKAVIFLASPHAGARLANYIGLLGRVLRTTVAVEDLSANDPHLRELTQWYRNNAQQLQIDTRVFFETQNTAGVRIVDETSADPGIAGVIPVPVDADHFSICKPVNRDALVYKSIRQFVAHYAPLQPKQTTQPSTEASIASVSASSGQAPRLFVSYRRRAVDDARLATLLVTELRKVGCEVFIDVDIPLGVDWSAEIARRIEWCDYLVVLLSEDSIDSEMVQSEVRLAHQRRRDDGSPHILPIRVRYEGLLDYELAAYLGRLQHVVWSDAADDSLVVKAVIAAAQSGKGAIAAADAGSLEEPTVVADQRRPRPSVDRSALLRPTGTLRLEDPYYIARPADESIARLAPCKGETLVIKGARQMGKSSLLVRYISACKQAGKRVAFLDFQGMSDAQLDEYPAFLHRVLSIILRRLDLDAERLPTIESGLDVTDLVEARVLDRINTPIVFAFDEVDRLLGRPWQKDFFAMLRQWHNRRWMEPWANVDLGLVIATEPYLLVDSEYQSPFNVGEIVQMGPFSESAVAELNDLYGSPLTASQCHELFELTNGQPYLTRVALYRLVAEANATWQALQTAADSDEGPFADHLKALLMLLQRSGLGDAMREVIRRGRVPGEDRLTYYRLRGAGLVTEKEGRVVPANLLYARFFKKFLR